MTATLAAIFVERGALRWDAPLREVFPDVNVHPGYANVPLAALTHHSAGLPRGPSAADRSAVESLDDGRAQRLALAVPVLERAPDHEPGTFLYSNLGYTLLGAAIERVSGRPFEETMVNEIFTPLGMKSCVPPARLC